MLNQIVVVGRIKNKGVLEENENGRNVMTITLAVPRSYKNSEGEYDTDFIPVTLFSEISRSTNEYCKEGDIVGVKGRLQRLEGNSLQVIAEKVSFLSTRKEEE